MRVFSLAASDLLDRLKAAGVRLKIQDGELRYRCQGEISAEVKAEMELHRQGLTELVEAGEADWRVVVEYEITRTERQWLGKRSDGKLAEPTDKARESAEPREGRAWPWTT